tara:strand:+ start:57 stop:224 length:168 start_codon:yes stop_codon:yes gene_type:complete
MKIAIEIDGKRYSSEGDDDILEVLTKLLIDAGEIDDDGILSVIDDEDSAILNYAH